MRVVFTPTDSPTGKLADAELHFDGLTFDGPENLSGLKLIGFGVWTRKNGELNVTFPARQYSVRGERRSYAILRPIADAMAMDALREKILGAWKEHSDAPR